MSARTLADPGIVEHIAGLLAERPIPPGALVIEVTETAAIGNIERARLVARDCASSAAASPWTISAPVSRRSTTSSTSSSTS